MVSTSENDASIEYTLENEDYTIGCVLNHLLFKNYFEDKQTISFCGFKKLHPHDTDGIIRIMFKESGTESDSVSDSPSLQTSLQTSLQRQKQRQPHASPDYYKSPEPHASPGYYQGSDGDSTPPPPLDTPPLSTIQRAPSPDYYKSPEKKISGGSRGGGASFKVIGFDYIKKCCNDAIEIFETIEQLIDNKKE